MFLCFVLIVDFFSNNSPTNLNSRLIGSVNIAWNLTYLSIKSKLIFTVYNVFYTL